MKASKVPILSIVFVILVITTLISVNSETGILQFMKAKPDVKNVELKIAITPFNDTAIPVVGFEKKIFLKHGINLKLNDCTWPQQFDMLAGGAIDIAMATLDEIIVKDNGLRAVDRQIEYLLPCWQFLGLSFFANSKIGIKSLEIFKKEYADKRATNLFLDQLIGRKITYPEGSLFEQAFLRFLTLAGRDKKEFSIVNTESEAGLNGLEDSSVAMAAVGSQQFAEANRRGYEIAISPRDLGAIVITGFITPKSFREANPDIIKKFVCAWYETVRWVNDNPKESYEIINTYLAKKGSTSNTYDEYLDLKQLNVIARNPEAAQKLFMNEDSPAYWKITWQKTVETLKQTGKLTAIPKDTNSFVVPWTLKEVSQSCPGR